MTLPTMSNCKVFTVVATGALILLSFSQVALAQIATVSRITSPVIVANQAAMTQGLLSGVRIDAPMSTYSVLGQRYWLTSGFQQSPGGIKHSLMKGDLGSPYGAVAWVKDTCNRNSNNFCINGANTAFTTISPTDVWDLWFTSVYQPQPNTGNLLAFVHEERVNGSNGSNVGRTRIGIAWSTNNGNTWNYLGRIISPYGDPDGFNITGAPYFVKDGYFYVYYRDRDVTGADLIGVARASVSAVVAAASSGSLGSNLWKKYHSGGFSEPGLGGLASATLNSAGNNLWGITHTQAAHSSFNGKYYLLLSSMAWDGEDSYVRLYETSNGINWTLAHTLALEPASTLHADGGYQYCSLVDSTGVHNAVVGQRFFAYCAKDPFEPIGASAKFSMYRWEVNLGTSVDAFRQSSDFSSSQGPYWSYLTFQKPNINSMSWTGAYWNGSDVFSIIESQHMHPGTTETPLLDWTAPKAGNVRIEGTVRDADLTCGDGVMASVLHSGSPTSLFSQAIANGDTVGKSIDKTVAVTAGDDIVFAISGNGSNYCDSTLWDPSITYLP